jgi:hypothetical protein
MNDYHIMLNGQLFEVHSSLKSAKDTVRCMKKNGDFDSTDKIKIIEIAA